MSTQSTLPFASLAVPLSPQYAAAVQNNKRELEVDDIQLDTDTKRVKLDDVTSQKEQIPLEIQLQTETITVEESDDLSQDQPQEVESDISKDTTEDLVSNTVTEITSHKKQQSLQEQKIKKAKEEEKEMKRLKKEQEKLRREEKKKQIELEKLQKRTKIEEERKRKKEELERQKEEKRKKLEMEREEKRLKLEQEKEDKRRKLEQEKEEKRKKLEQEKEDKRKKLEKEKLDKLKEKELAERRKLEEEERKNRAQMKIGSFFKTKSEVSSPNTSKIISNELPNYSNSFLLFYIKENVEVFQQCTLSQDELALNNAKFISSLSDTASDALNFFQTCSNSFTKKIRTNTAFEVVQALNNNNSETEVLKMLENVPRKYLSFYENLRPPYSGTISKTIHSIKQLYDIEINKNPFLKVNDATIDYSYDSDLEWNPEEDDEGEGEEIDEEEMSAPEASDDEDDDDDFLEKDMMMKKRTLIGPLVPVIKTYSDLPADSEDDKYFQSLSMQSLRFECPIDPYKNYWDNKPDITATQTPEIITVASLNPSVASSKPALSPLKLNNNTVNVLTGHKKSKQVITNDIELLKVLQYVMSNNDLSISTLVELTRKSLDNKYPNLVVRATIDKHFNKKNKKTYELNDGQTIENLEAVVKGIKAEAN